MAAGIEKKFLAAPVEGPGAKMGRMETSTINLLSIPVSNSDISTAPTPSTPSNSFDFGMSAFNFLKSVAPDPTVEGSINQMDGGNSMKYKRHVRRVSLTCPDGKFQLDLTNIQKPGSGVSGSPESPAIKVQLVKDFELELPSRPSTVNLVQEELPTSTISTLARIDQLGISSDRSGIDSPSFSDDFDTSAASGSSALAVPAPPGRLARRRSIVELVEEGNIQAAPIEGLQALHDKALARDQAQEEAKESKKSGLLGSIRNHWFFRNPDAEDEADGLPTFQPSAIEGVGGGVLTERVISALKLNQDPKEVRRMNAWAPQGM